MLDLRRFDEVVSVCVCAHHLLPGEGGCRVIKPPWVLVGWKEQRQLGDHRWKGQERISRLCRAGRAEHHREQLVMQGCAAPSEKTEMRSIGVPL